MYHRSSQRVADPLQSVTDAQHWETNPEKFQRQGRAALATNGIRAPGEDDPRRVRRTDLFEGRMVGGNFAVYRQLPHSAGDQLGILRTEIENENILTVNDLLPGIIDARFSRRLVNVNRKKLQ